MHACIFFTETLLAGIAYAHVCFDAYARQAASEISGAARLAAQQGDSDIAATGKRVRMAHDAHVASLSYTINMRAFVHALRSPDALPSGE